LRILTDYVHSRTEHAHSVIYKSSQTDNKFENKPFNFLHLPAEIRNRIYELVLENGSCKGQELTKCLHLPHHIHLIPRNQYSPLVEEIPIHCLLVANKQIRFEFRGLFTSMAFLLQPRVRADISLFRPWLLSHRPTRIHLSYPLLFDHKGNTVIPSGSKLTATTIPMKCSSSKLGPMRLSIPGSELIRHTILMIASFDLSGPKTVVSVAIDETPMLPQQVRERWARWLTLSMNWPLRQSRVTISDLNGRLEEALKVFEDEVFEWCARWGSITSNES